MRSEVACSIELDITQVKRLEGQTRCRISGSHRLRTQQRGGIDRWKLARPAAVDAACRPRAKATAGVGSGHTGGAGGRCCNGWPGCIGSAKRTSPRNETASAASRSGSTGVRRTRPPRTTPPSSPAPPVMLEGKDQREYSAGATPPASAVSDRRVGPSRPCEYPLKHGRVEDLPALAAGKRW